MPCYSPLKGWKKPNGGLTFKAHETSGIKLEVPCGKCIGCRLDYSYMWAARMMHEARFHPDSIMLTLTYSQDDLPTGATLVKSHVSSFLKKLRRRIQPTKVRFYACGEYGDENLRPHYHLVLFGFRPMDGKMVSGTEGRPRYTSAMLEKIWGYGFVEYSEVVPETCAYVARYVTKKITGEPAKKHYERFDSRTGEIYEVIPEFALMSRRPGIGLNHYEQHKTDIYPDDFIVLNGRRAKTPRYYDRQLEKEHPEAYEKIKRARRKRAIERADDSTPERLLVREKCLRAKIRSLKRQL